MRFFMTAFLYDYSTARIDLIERLDEHHRGHDSIAVGQTCLRSLASPSKDRVVSTVSTFSYHALYAEQYAGAKPLSIQTLLGRERPVVMLPDRALCLLTFSHLLIVNKSSSSSSSSLHM